MLSTASKLEMLFGIPGFILLWYATDWRAALGVTLMLMGNNFAHSVKKLSD